MNFPNGRNKALKVTTSIETCRVLVAQKFSGSDYREWKNSDFIKLSAQIRRNTKVHISENTLKRFFGKLKSPEDYQPQKATRDALAVYIGYADWKEFDLQEIKIKKQIENSGGYISEKSSIKSTSYKSHFARSVSISLKISIGILIIFSSIFIYRYGSRFFSSRNVRLLCINAKGHSPHSALFKLHSQNSKNIQPNQFEIDFKNWKKGISKWKESTISCYYEKPGVYYPVLYQKGVAIDSTQVMLFSKGWEVTIQVQNDTLRLYPIIQSAQGLSHPSNITSQNVQSAGVDTMKTFFTNFSYVKEDSISADNISLEAYIEASKSRPGVRCSQADITIYGSKNSHYFSLMRPECISWTYYKFGEIIKNGKNDDLSEFGHDMVKKRKLNVEIYEQKVSIYLDNNLIFRTKYTKPIGKFMGLNFMFGGIGRIEKVAVKGL